MDDHSPSSRSILQRLADGAMGPPLKHAGYARSRRAWRKANANVAIVALQSRSGFGDSLEFTINCGVWSASLRAADPTLSETPYFDPWGCHLMCRLGELLRDRKPDDYWWLIDERTDQKGLLENFKNYTESLIIPFLASVASDRGLRDHWTKLLEKGKLWEPEIDYLQQLAGRLGPKDLSERVRIVREEQANDTDDGQAAFATDLAAATRSLRTANLEPVETGTIIRTPPG